MARFATVHWFKFPGIATSETLSFAGSPRNCVSFKIGPDGPEDPGGPLFVMTTAAYNMDPDLDLAREGNPS